MVSTSRCGRDILGSTPGRRIFCPLTHQHFFPPTRIPRYSTYICRDPKHITLDLRDHGINRITAQTAEGLNHSLCLLSRTFTPNRSIKDTLRSNSIWQSNTRRFNHHSSRRATNYKRGAKKHTPDSLYQKDLRCLHSFWKSCAAFDYSSHSPLPFNKPLWIASPSTKWVPGSVGGFNSSTSQPFCPPIWILIPTSFHKTSWYDLKSIKNMYADSSNDEYSMLDKSCLINADETGINVGMCPSSIWGVVVMTKYSDRQHYWQYKLTVSSS